MTIGSFGLVSSRIVISTVLPLADCSLKPLMTGCEVVTIGNPCESVPATLPPGAGSVLLSASDVGKTIGASRIMY